MSSHTNSDTSSAQHEVVGRKAVSDEDANANATTKLQIGEAEQVDKNSQHSSSTARTQRSSSSQQNQNANRVNNMDYDSIISSIASTSKEYEHLQAQLRGSKPIPKEESWYERFIVGNLVKQFVPAYFVSVMGTGISSTILYHFPFPAYWLEVCSYIMFGICCILFIVNLILFIMQCIYFPGKLRSYHVDPLKASYMGAFSMGFTTIVNYTSFITKGDHMYLVWTLWWISVASAVYTAFPIVYFSFFSKLNAVESDSKLNATLLLPIVALTVTSSSGHLIELNLYTLNETVITMIVSYMLWALSICLAFAIITIYIWRLIMHKIPPTQLIFTGFLPVGFLGQSSYSIYLFGNNLNELIPKELIYGKIFLCIGGFLGLFILSFGYYMTFIAIMSIFSKIRPFAKTPNLNHTNKYGLLKHHKGFWAMTFPLCTMSLSNTEIGKGGVGNYPLLAFKVMGAVFAVAGIGVTVACLVGVAVYSYGLIRSELRVKYRKHKQDLMV
ncbi:Ssu1 protein [Candida orthopsilosis Co 90-125]|uniref:Ssu1 protein n=1 Tax=Candida orthopsilosis (strain 90-125) TaxID=1136231 RepID=H8XAH7_CANO9|nr:Ssu1 protein [Candida orthopsilosis Co 90-125]CCG24826.1 Ssu1 protein [Candida orthopsilosis Co 90-125]